LASSRKAKGKRKKPKRMVPVFTAEQDRCGNCTEREHCTVRMRTPKEDDLPCMVLATHYRECVREEEADDADI